MKQFTLLSLIPRNFKGVRAFTLETNGKDASVLGNNATGKTTLFDAFTWQLFHKDSQNKTDFGIKTVDAAGQPIHNLEHEVEGSFLIDGRRTTLRKVYKEVWTRPRGALKAEFGGHTTDYFIDGVPTPKKDYDAFISSIIDEATFKLLTSPSYFSEQLHWKDRRKTLLTVCGDITDEDVISGNKDLSKLPGILAGRSIDDHRKVIGARQSKINEELRSIPVRIDEATRSIPDTDGLNETEIAARIDDLSAQISDKQAEISRIQSGGQVTVKENRLREIEGELQQLKNQIQGAALELVAAKRRDVHRIQKEADDLKFEIDSTERRISAFTSKIAEHTDEANRMAAKWKSVDAETFEHQHDDNCPTCGQALPEESLRTAYETALAAFNRSKAERLENINNIGKKAASEARRLRAEMEAVEASLPALRDQHSAKLDDTAKANAELADMQASVQDVETDPAYIQKREELASVRREIVALQESSQAAVDAVRAEIVNLRTELSALQQDQAKFSVAADARKRIAELEQQEKDLAAEFEELERQLFLTEEFIRTKVSMLEAKINSKFKLAKFKLFKQQVNGGLEECCEPTFGGVPYGEGLNNAARINVGLDIINTLSEHYGVSVPIFIDNAESVVEPIATVGQKIRLIVSEKDKKLRVEAEAAKEAVSA